MKGAWKMVIKLKRGEDASKVTPSHNHAGLAGKEVWKHTESEFRTYEKFIIL